MGLQNILESKEVREEISSVSFLGIYWAEEGANFKIDANDDCALGAPHRPIYDGTIGKYALPMAIAGANVKGFVPVDVMLSPRGVRFSRPEMIKREVRVDELKQLIYGGDGEIKKELLALLRSYEIPERYAEEVEHRLRELVREEVRRRKLPEEEWLINALYRILVHMAYVMLYV
jgi:hypothetical protein